MRLGLDLREFSHTRGGIGRYSGCLARALCAEFLEDEFFLLGHDRFPENAFRKGVDRSMLADGWKFGWRRSFWENACLPFWIGDRHLDIFHATSHITPPFHGKTRLVFTVHDMTNFLFPEWYSPRNNAYRKRMIERGIRKSTRIIAVSEATARDIGSLFPEAIEKVRVIPEGVDPIFVPFRADCMADLPDDFPKVCQAPYVLHVGTLSPRKNLERLIDAFLALPDRPETRGVRLVLVGEKGWKNEPVLRRIEETGSDRVVYTGPLSPPALLAVLQRARLLCMTSRYEGFGLPILEAMACGVPVLASNTSSLPELVPDRFCLADPDSTESIAYALERLLTDESLRERSIGKGLEKAKEYTWERTARMTWEVYRETLD